MEELSLISRQEPGIASLDNFEELKQTLTQQLKVYENIVYTADGLKAAKADKAALNKLKKAIDSRRKEIKEIYMQPYTILDNIKGKGQYIGTYMHWGVKSNGWWGEGEIKFYIDGDTDCPSICGTGTED